MRKPPMETRDPRRTPAAEGDAGVKKLCDQIRDIAYDIRVYLHHGHLEKIYHTALRNRLRKAGIDVQEQFALKVYDEDGALLGDYFADLFVNQCLIVEIKACANLVPEHEAQVLGYMRAAHIRHGLLVNFGAPKFQIRKFIL